MVALHTTMKMDVQKMDKSTESLQSDIVIKNIQSRDYTSILNVCGSLRLRPKFLNEFINTNY